MEGERRKRLKKLKSNAVPPPSDLIPKKKNAPIPEKIVRPRDEDSDNSIEDFITDRVEFDRGGFPISSEESAHSTDEEHHTRKKKKVKEESSSESPVSSSEDLLRSDSEQSVGEEGKQKQILIGKQALEEKRKQGLIPTSKKEESSEAKSGSKKKKKKKTEEESKPKEKPPGKKNKDPKKYVQFSEFSEKERKKAEMTTKILQRWWYALDDWPPEDYTYSDQLFDSKLRLVSKENWSVEPVFNENGLEKVLLVPGYAGLFVTHLGNVKDLRPTQSCPSFDNIFNKPMQEIREILVKALSNQIEQLKIQPKFDKELMKDLIKELAYYQKQL